MCQQEDQPIPFYTAYRWMIRSQHRVKRLPLIGHLLGYLLAADLTYTGQVAAPSLWTMGALLHEMRGFGAARALHQAGLVEAVTPTQDEFISAFTQVYNFLDGHLTEEEKTCIQFDPIMVEHMLCKYQRLLREMKAKPGEDGF